MDSHANFKQAINYFYFLKTNPLYYIFQYFTFDFFDFNNVLLITLQMDSYANFKHQRLLILHLHQFVGLEPLLFQIIQL